MMEEVGYMTETLSRRHRENPEEEDETNLVQAEKRRKSGTHRRRSATTEEGDGATQEGEEPASSSNVPPGPSTGEGSTRYDPINLRQSGETVGSNLYGLPRDGGGKPWPKHCQYSR